MHKPVSFLVFLKDKIGEICKNLSRDNNHNFSVVAVADSPNTGH